MKLTAVPGDDSDGDGLPSAWETQYGLDPNDNGSVNPAHGATGDPDNDGLTNARELAQGTKPNDADTDDDGLNDGLEVTMRTSPVKTDTDEDGLSDGDEVNVRHTNPLHPDSPLAALVAEYRRTEQAIAFPRTANTMDERIAARAGLHFNARGDVDLLGELVMPDFLQMFADRNDVAKSTGSGRRELAESLLQPEHPLTSRVYVNRVWQWVFGTGLVGTMDNFGRLGEKPTHPELLDYLATRFVEHGWSVKEAIRFLVTSRAFQQTAVASPDARRIDPGNELLSHAGVRRLEAESIRDAVLAVSGQLDQKMYGPGVNVYYVAKTEGGGAKGPLDGDRRRSVYQRIRRNAHNPFLEAFDAPKPMSTRGKRDGTNVPAQSLTLLNDPFVIDQSAKWAKALVTDGLNRDERVRAMFVRALGRAATAEDLAGSREFLGELAAEHSIPAGDLEKSQRVWQDFAQSLFCLKEFIYVD